MSAASIFGVNKDGTTCQECIQMHGLCSQHASQQPEVMTSSHIIHPSPTISSAQSSSYAPPPSPPISLCSIPCDLIPHIALFDQRHALLRLINKQCDVAIRHFHGQGKCCQCKSFGHSSLSDWIEQREATPWLSASSLWLSDDSHNDPVQAAAQLTELEQMQSSLGPFFCPIRSIFICAPDASNHVAQQFLASSLSKDIQELRLKHSREHAEASYDLSSFLPFPSPSSSSFHCLASLTSLIMRHSPLNDADLIALSQWPPLSQLTKLELIHVEEWQALDGIGIRTLMNSPFFQSRKLRSLKVGCNLMTPRALQIIGTSPSFVNLSELLIGDNYMTRAQSSESLECFKSFASSAHLSNLSKLELSFWNMSDKHALILSSSTTLTRLTDLNLSDNCIRKRKTVHSFRRLQRLRKLDVSENPFERTPEEEDDFDPQEAKTAPICSQCNKPARTPWYEHTGVKRVVKCVQCCHVFCFHCSPKDDTLQCHSCAAAICDECSSSQMCEECEEFFCSGCSDDHRCAASICDDDDDNDDDEDSKF